jgi:hypothetical protein
MATLLAVAVPLVLVGLVLWGAYTVRAQHRRADAERRAMQERLGISSEPIKFVSNRLQERLDAGEHITREEVEEFIQGFSERIDGQSETTYLYFIVDMPILGRGGAWIDASYSEDGILTTIGWDSGDPLPTRRGTPVH